MRAFARIGGILSNVGLVVGLGFGLMLFVPLALGMHHYVILTGSMTGTYDRGSIIFDRPVPTQRLRVGDPITYNPPPGVSEHSRVTHRIFRITRDHDGLRTFQTKGDANTAPDSWRFQLPLSTQDKVVFEVPYAGFLLELLSIRQYRLVLTGIPALLVVLAVLRQLWRDSNEHDRTPGWGDIGERVHAAPPPLGGAAVAAQPVFVGLTRDGAPHRPAAHGRPTTQRRPDIARGPRVPQPNVVQSH
jgi:signal peptidase